MLVLPRASRRPAAFIDWVICCMPALPRRRALRSTARADTSMIRKPPKASRYDVPSVRMSTDETGHEAQQRPLQVAVGVRVDGRVGDVASQCRIGLVELLLDLAQDALFVLGERHRWIPSLNLVVIFPPKAIGHNACDLKSG